MRLASRAMVMPLEQTWATIRGARAQAPQPVFAAAAMPVKATVPVKP